MLLVCFSSEIYLKYFVENKISGGGGESTPNSGRNKKENVGYEAK